MGASPQRGTPCWGMGGTKVGVLPQRLSPSGLGGDHGGSIPVSRDPLLGRRGRGDTAPEAEGDKGGCIPPFRDLLFWGVGGPEGAPHHRGPPLGVGPGWMHPLPSGDPLWGYGEGGEPQGVHPLLPARTPLPGCSARSRRGGCTPLSRDMGWMGRSPGVWGDQGRVRVPPPPQQGPLGAETRRSIPFPHLPSRLLLGVLPAA